MTLEDAISNIQSSRKAILFVGAGFANDAINLLGQPTPSAKQLTKEILSHLDIAEESELGLAIDMLREKEPPAAAFDFISNNLSARNITATQSSVLSMPWTRIYTTNIDNIGSTFSGRRWRDAAVNKDPLEKGDFVYLHGCIDNCSITNFFQRLKMGEQLYLAGSHSQSLYHHLLQQDLHEADCVIVVGYSMGDPDLATVFFNSPNLLNKCFVFSGRAEGLSGHRIKLIGNSTGLRSEDLVRLYRDRPEEAPEKFSASIEVGGHQYDTKEVTQAARQNLLVFGRYDENIARTTWDMPEAPAYVVRRSIAETLATSTPPACIIVHSHLGNGKTLAFELAKYLVAKRAGRSFAVRPDLDSDGLRTALSEIPPGSHVFFEGNIFSLQDAFTVIEERSLVVCATARTTTLQVAIPPLRAAGKSMVRVFDANQLSSSELEQFHDIVDSMGFWPPELRSLERTRRLEILRGKYESNINAIVVHIFENPVIREMIDKQWVSAYRELSGILDHFIVRSYMQIIDVYTASYVLNEFQNIDYSILKEIENDIIRVTSSGNVSFGNAIIGEYVMQSHHRKEDIIGAVVRFCNFIDLHPAQRTLQPIVRRLLRHRNLRRLLHSEKLPLEVFDRASHIGSVRSDPLFWVQYSISQMENGDFFAAYRLLGTAYARAEKRGAGFDTYQIDTHAARLTARKIEAHGLYDGAFEELVAGAKRLREVVERRPDDTYHVAAVTVQILRLGLPWSHTLKPAAYGSFRRDMLRIGKGLSEPPSMGIMFVTERQALDLISQLE